MNVTTPLHVFALITNENNIVLIRVGNKLMMPAMTGSHGPEQVIISQMSEFFSGIMLSRGIYITLPIPDFSWGETWRPCHFKRYQFEGNMRPGAGSSICLLGKNSFAAQSLIPDFQPLASLSIF